MALINAYLVRWARGLLPEVIEQPSIDLYGRHEGYLPLNGSQSPVDAERVARAVLAVRAYPQVATTIGIRPTGAGDNPYVDFDLGDWLPAPDEDGTTSLARVRSLGTRDHPANTGQAIFVPELRSLPAEQDDVLTRWLQRMSTGGGGSHATAPPAAQLNPPRPDKEPVPPFSLAVVRIAVSGRYYATEPCRLTKMIPSLNLPGKSSTIVQVYRGVGTDPAIPLAGATATWAAGESGPVGEIYLAVDLARGDYLQSATTAAGGGAAGLTVQLVIV